MRKIFIVLIAVLLILAGCAAPSAPDTPIEPDTPVHEHTPTVLDEVPAVCGQPGLTEGSKCSECGEILVAQQEVVIEHTPVTDEAVAPTVNTVGRTEGSHCELCGEVLVAQELYILPVAKREYYITTEPTVIENSRFRISLPAGIYVPTTLEEDFNKILDLNEQVTGLSYYPAGNEPLIEITVTIPANGQEYYSAWGGETGAWFNPGDMLTFTGEHWVPTHELLHTLNARNGKLSCTVLSEGFTTYFVERVREQQAIISTFDGYSNYAVGGFENLTKEKAVELFIEVDSDSWFGYQYGFRFMHFMMEEYGLDRWIEFSKQCKGFMKHSEVATKLQEFFGEDIFAKFASWMNENGKLFTPGTRISDFTEFEVFDVYPYFGAWAQYMPLSFTYADGFRLEYASGFEYLTEYKGLELSGEFNFKFHIRSSIMPDTEAHTTAHFFDKDGKHLRSIEAENFRGGENSFSVPGTYTVIFEGDGRAVKFDLDYDTLVKK